MPKPLEGIVVLETASFVSGPYVGQLLADLGADVIKIENPKGGDPFRHPSGYSSEFQAYNPNKRSVALDITTSDGSDVLRHLVGKADVLIHNFRPGVMERLGFGWNDLSPLNARLIYCSLTGFGHDGPYQHRPSYDSVAGALSGFLANMSQRRIRKSSVRRCLTPSPAYMQVMACWVHWSSAAAPGVAAASMSPWLKR